MVKRWIPLEANPDVLNDFAKGLGLDTSKFQFCDVYGLDEELLAMVPQPCLALLLLFPVTDAAEAAKAKEAARQREAGHDAAQDPYFMHQHVRNACGTIGALHAIGNLPGHPPMKAGSFLEAFLQETRSMTPEQRGSYLENPPSDGPSIDSAHEEAARSGATAAPPAEEPVNLHFVCLTHHNGRLWELDGNNPYPVDHVATSPAALLTDAAKVVRKVIDSSPNSHSFNLIALTAAS